MDELLRIKQQFGIIGNSPKLNHALQTAIQVAPTEMTVLINGESGSGKESFSKIIHKLSARKHNTFIAINCGAIPEGTIDSELFGHEKGAFTGASDKRKGYFEVTDGGTIFLDEIAEMPLSTQSRLLRVLENGEYIRVGSSKVQRTNVRVVTASHVDLYRAVQKGQFREDLYYRLNTIPIHVPPLRERGADIYLLFRKFVADFSEKQRTPPISLTEEAQHILNQYRFPGNIRQLKNLADQISVLEMSRVINAETLIKYLPKHSEKTFPVLHSAEQDFSDREILYKVLFDMKKDMNELKKIVLEAIKDGSISQSTLSNHQTLFDSIEEEPTSIISPTATPSPLLLEEKTEPFIASNASFTPSSEQYEANIEDITHEIHEESLSLDEKEKELIIKALNKNKNKRKYAAEDLGISERTLYRKIKHYDISK